MVARELKARQRALQAILCERRATSAEINFRLRSVVPSYRLNSCGLWTYTYHLTCGISSLLHSVKFNLILFTLLLVHLILRISPHHSHHLRSHHLSLPRPFTPDFKLIPFTNPFLHCLSGSFQTAFHAFTDLELVPD